METLVNIRFVLFGSLIALLVVGAFAQEFCTRGVRASCAQPSACLNFQCATYTSYGNAQFRNLMLDGHNSFRKSSLHGWYGADMIQMRWSRELEDNALRWIQSLCSRRAFHHDSKNCRLTPSFDSVGQNLWNGSGQIYGNILTAARSALHGWHNERRLISDLGMVFPFRGTNPTIGHETQLMWAKSFYVGCAYIRAPDRYLKFRTYIACNYAEAGNRVNENMFHPSRTLASACLPGTRRGRSGLCEVFDEGLLRYRIRLGRTE